MKAVWDTSGNTSSIFVTKSEYAKYHNTMIPLWGLYISGHGLMDYTITSLSIPQFKEFLLFLENKIYTRLLYYDTCYGAGVNNELLYKDAEKNIDKTYPFAIITQALTDAPTRSNFGLTIAHGAVQLKPYTYFFDFFDALTRPDVIDYYALVQCITPNLTRGLESLPQIKFPGLSWFSVVDTEKVVSIGTILAKNRTAPLDIATFFTKKGKKAAPLGILLYAADIPFEIIINTVSFGYPPAIISMIPGTAVHHMKKISSLMWNVDKMLMSFLTVRGLASPKTFIIDEITGIPLGTISNNLNIVTKSNLLTLQNVVIMITPQENTVYFTYDGIAYKADMQADSVQRAQNADKAKYMSILNKYSKKFPTQLVSVFKKLTVTLQDFQNALTLP